MSSRARTWALLDTVRGGGRAAVALHGAIMALIVLNVIAVVLESIPRVAARWAGPLHVFEFFSVFLFIIEYLARAWACTAAPRYATPWGRLRYLCSPMALVDLIAILPTLLLFLPFDLRVMRALRLVRLARLGKLGRYSEASSLLMRVLRTRREELLLSFSLLAILAVICASLMYYVEGAAQPEAFPHIPAALWWAFITITTVGYGDVYPVTALGRVLGGATALLGILMLALPTGVFGAAFIDEVNRQKRAAAQPRACPHCGGPLDPA